MDLWANYESYKEKLVGWLFGSQLATDSPLSYLNRFFI